MSDTTQQLSDRAQPGRRIGPYRLLELIGTGGMGEVWLAEQKEPLRRKVALKLIRTGFSSREVLARFEAERQALALMEHPHIAKVFDAGEHQGLPYFVMEYVRGLPIHDFCDREKLPLEARLGLFQQVCDAIQHAHQKAIVHRDLKPSNILVTEQDGRPVPKVIDFGVAKALAQPLTELTFHTQMGQLIGTPLYMSPEQADARSHDVDTRSDVYSLGVILYELLTGTLPFDPEELAEAGYEGMLRVLREKMPARPSTRVGTLAETAERVAAARGRRPRTLRSDLTGDLDWITMRCLEKDRKRRYPGPGDLARDIERHLRLVPVEAGPPSLRYRLDRFVRRNKAPVALGTTLAVAVIVVAIVSIIQSGRVAEQRDLAIEQMERAEAEARRAEAAHLYTLGANEETPSNALAHAIASLDLADQEHVRRLALRALRASPTWHRFAESPDAHNAWCIEFSPDGRWLAVGWSERGCVQLYSLEQEEPIELVGHADWVTTLAFTSDSTRLISSATDGSFRMWSVPDGKLVKSLETNAPAWTTFRATEDDATIIAASATPDHVDWWRWRLDTNSQEMIGRWERSAREFDWGGAIDPSGEWVAYGEERAVYLVSLRDLDVTRRTLLGHHTAHWKLSAFSDDGRHLITGDVEGEVRMWQLDSGEPRLLRVYRAGGQLAGIGFDRTNERAYVGHGAGMLLFDLTAPPLTEPALLRQPGRNWLFHMDAHPFLPWLVTSGMARSVEAWLVPEEESLVLRPFMAPDPTPYAPDQQFAVAFTPDGAELVVEITGGIVVWPLSPDAGREPRTIYQMRGANLENVMVDRSGKWVFATLNNGSTGNGTVVMVSIDGSTERTWTDFVGVAWALQVDPERRFVAVTGRTSDGRSPTRIWSLESGSSVDLEMPGDPWAASVGFTNSGKLLLRHGSSLALVDPESGQWQPFKEGVLRGQMLEDGRTLFWRDQHDNEWLEDLENGSTRRLPPYDPGRGSTAFDLVKQQMVAGYVDGSIVLTSIDGSTRHLLLGHTNMVWGLAFDPLGRWIASSSADGTLRLWAMPSGVPMQDLPHERLLSGLKARTALRAVPDSTSHDRYSLTAVPFAGWDPPQGW